MSSPPDTLGPWVRIPLEAWISLCIYCVCVVLCVGSDLATGSSPIQGVPSTGNRIRNLKKQPRPNRRAVEPLITVIMIIIIITALVL
jgi:hypothetical protein